MRAALCNFCLRSGVLCSRCQDKLRSGEVTQTDVEVARLLLSLEEENPSLRDVCLYKAVEASGTLALLVKRGDRARLLSYRGRVLKALSDKMGGKSIRILEHGVSDRKFLEDLFAPLDIVTISTIWLPDGTTEMRVILKRKGRLKVNVKTLKKLAKEIRGLILRVEFTD